MVKAKMDSHPLTLDNSIRVGEKIPMWDAIAIKQALDGLKTNIENLYWIRSGPSGEEHDLDEEIKAIKELIDHWFQAFK
jgi:hypothetical protein